LLGHTPYIAAARRLKRRSARVILKTVAGRPFFKWTLVKLFTIIGRCGAPRPPTGCPGEGVCRWRLPGFAAARTPSLNCVFARLLDKTRALCKGLFRRGRPRLTACRRAAAEGFEAARTEV